MGYLTIIKSYIDIRLVLLEIWSGEGWNWPPPKEKLLSKKQALFGLILYVSEYNQ